VVRLIIDADAAIKLYRSGILAEVVKAFSCEMPEAVYNEVVTQGKRRLYQDAEEIEAIIAGKISIIATSGTLKPEMGLGAGESGILDVLREKPDLIVVSDDRRFLTVLSKMKASFITPADTLVLLARRNSITRSEAGKALEQLRPLIRSAAYYEARDYLEHRGEI
jgi:hypothetical protein